MASLVLSGDTSGSITVAAPAVAGSNTQTLAAVTGTLAPVVSGTAQTAPFSTNTRADFSSIPTWVKRVTVMFSALGTSGTSNIRVQIGTSGTLVTSGYSGSTTNAQNANATNSTAYPGGGFDFVNTSASNVYHGALRIQNISGNIWVADGLLAQITGANGSVVSGGSVTLSGALTDLRVTTVNGTDTFDTGSVINILFE
jgi:hypothetical protein